MSATKCLRAQKHINTLTYCAAVTEFSMPEAKRERARTGVKQQAVVSRDV